VDDGATVSPTVRGFQNLKFHELSDEFPGPTLRRCAISQLKKKTFPMASSGCWTCHARKKKRPGPSINSPFICATCTTLQITCYGFGGAVKPSWLDGQTPADKKERAQKMEEIRSGVKRTTDSLRRARALTGLRRQGRAEWRTEGQSG